MKRTLKIALPAAALLTAVALSAPTVARAATLANMERERAFLL